MSIVIDKEIANKQLVWLGLPNDLLSCYYDISVYTVGQLLNYSESELKLDLNDVDYKRTISLVKKLQKDILEYKNHIINNDTLIVFSRLSDQAIYGLSKLKCFTIGQLLELPRDTIKDSKFFVGKTKTEIFETIKTINAEKDSTNSIDKCFYLEPLIYTDFNTENYSINSNSNGSVYSDQARINDEILVKKIENNKKDTESDNKFKYFNRNTPIIYSKLPENTIHYLYRNKYTTIGQIAKLTINDIEIICDISLKEATQTYNEIKKMLSNDAYAKTDNNDEYKYYYLDPLDDKNKESKKKSTDLINETRNEEDYTISDKVGDTEIIKVVNNEGNKLTNEISLDSKPATDLDFESVEMIANIKSNDIKEVILNNNDILALNNSIDENSGLTSQPILSKDPELENNSIISESKDFKNETVKCKTYTSIIESGLSTRSINGLMREKYTTLEQLADLSEEDIKKIRYIGAKSASEIFDKVQQVISTNEDGCISESINNKSEEKNMAKILDNETTILTPIRLSGMSNRAIHGLMRAKYFSFDQIINFSKEDIARIKNIGRQTAEEIYQKLQLIKQVNEIYENKNEPCITEETFSKHTVDILLRMKLYSAKDILRLDNKELEIIGNQSERARREIELFKSSFSTSVGIPETLKSKELLNNLANILPIKKSKIIEVINKVYFESNAKEAVEFIDLVCRDEAIKSAFKLKLLFIIKKYADGIRQDDLLKEIPESLLDAINLQQLISDLLDSNKIYEKDNLLFYKYPLIREYIDENFTGRDKDVILARLEGYTLEECGAKFGITRERVRQVVQSRLRRRPKVYEDRFLYLYNNYEISKPYFYKIFPNESQDTYGYLSNIFRNGMRLNKSLKEAFDDENIEIKTREKIKALFYDDYINIEGLYIKKKRTDIAKYLIRKYCVADTKFSDFVVIYQKFINDKGLSEEESLKVGNPYSFENHLLESKFVVRKLNQVFRYYSIESKDYSELISQINLGRFNNLQISTLKLFREFPDLMIEYDIHDEYELYDVLKKTWDVCTDGTKVDFRRTPSLRIGNVDLKKQITEFMLSNVPIKKTEFAEKFEDVYGIKALTLIGSYLSCIDKYLFNGSYILQDTPLNNEQITYLKDTLNEDVYSIKQIEEIFSIKYPNSNLEAINPYNLNIIGFRTYSAYVINKKYNDALDYYRKNILSLDVIVFDRLNSIFTSTSIFNEYFHRSIRDQDIIEFSPRQYINIRRLESFGVNKCDLHDFCDLVDQNSNDGEYFTIFSLRKNGIKSKLDDLGMESKFFESILNNNLERFSSFTLQYVRVYCKEKKANSGDFIAEIVKKYQSIEIDKLIVLLSEDYGIEVNHGKLMKCLSDSDLYYNTIMQKIYISYEKYLEEV